MASKTKVTKRSATKEIPRATKKSKVVTEKLPSPPTESEEEAESSGDDISDSSEDESNIEEEDEEEEEEEEEDELDELDDDEIKVDAKDSDEEEDEDEEDKEDDEDDEEKEKVVDPNKKTSAEQHAEQRKLLAERKLQRKSGQEVQQIKSLWERLRVTKPTPPKEVRDKLCDEIWRLAQDIVLDLVMKHDASRIIQTLVKYSTKERRDVIVNSLKGHYYVLATSSYGKYLLVKLLHYGSKESRAVIVNELHGKLRKLMRHKEGAYVVEDLFVLYSSADQKHQMIREFWGAEYAVFKESGKGKTVLEVTKESSEKKQLISTNLAGTIKASVEKGSTGFQILHAAMKEYVSILEDDIEANDAAIREFIDILSEQFAELVHTQEGSEVASTLIALANAKERKLIIRSLKSHTTELIKNEFGNSVLITLFMTVDDTVLLHKSFSAEIFTPELIFDLVKEKFSRRPLLYLLKGLDGKYFSPLIQKQLKKYEELAYKKTSKKPQEQRRNELAVKAIPLLYQGVLSTLGAENPEKTFEKLLSVNIAAQFVTELILTNVEVEEVNTKLRPQLLDAIFERTVKGDVLEDFHLINKVPFISRSLKALIQGNEFKFNNETKKLEAIENAEKIEGTGSDFAKRVVSEVLENNKLSDWTNGQGAFVIVSIFEVLQISKDAKFKELNQELKKIKKELVKNKDNKGAQLLLALLQ
ncbi:Puf family RNA-binding protein [Scheffersomyces xylosifermentans]|uniref:Puf family RNA-binding protein n=1 Tax=Scheffersomyces xylosifermentans TaxID=1304137 RepID=UPI00315D60E9